jgi:hypothetical protein
MFRCQKVKYYPNFFVDFLRKTKYIALKVIKTNLLNFCLQIFELPYKMKNMLRICCEFAQRKLPAEQREINDLVLTN